MKLWHKDRGKDNSGDQEKVDALKTAENKIPMQISLPGVPTYAKPANNGVPFISVDPYIKANPGYAGYIGILPEQLWQEKNSKTSTIKQLVYLERLRTNEKIYIDKSNFRIGKEKGIMDYCITDNRAISRSHAHINYKKDGYFIVDNNSTNYTYINGIIAKPGKELPLNDGDRVRLADEDFIFHCNSINNKTLTPVITTPPKDKGKLCPNCGNRLELDAKTCDRCGKVFALSRTSDKADNSSTDKDKKATKWGSDIVIDAVRKKRRGYILGGGLLCWIALGFALLALESSADSGWLFILVMGAILGILGIKVLKMGITSKKNPTLDKIFKKNPNLLSQADELYKNVIYRDEKLILSQKNLTTTRDITNITYTDEVFLIYLSTTRFTYLILSSESRSLIIETLRGRIEISYEPGEEKQIKKLAGIVAANCKNARIGHTQENLEYLKRMRQEWKDGARQATKMKQNENDKIKVVSGQNNGQRNDDMPLKANVIPYVAGADLFPVRYEAEHRAIRDIFFNGSRKDINAALTSGGLYSIYNYLFKKSNIVNPYRIEDFKVTARMPETNTMIVCVELPEPEKQPLCFRMYFILDGDLNAKALYTIEKGSDNGVFKGYLCQWKGETHANIQPLLETSWISDKDAKAEAELQMIMKAYKNDTDH